MTTRSWWTGKYGHPFSACKQPRTANSRASEPGGCLNHSRSASCCSLSVCMSVCASMCACFSWAVGDVKQQGLRTWRLPESLKVCFLSPFVCLLITRIQDTQMLCSFTELFPLVSSFTAVWPCVHLYTCLIPFCRNILCTSTSSNR